MRTLNALLVTRRDTRAVLRSLLTQEPDLLLAAEAASLGEARRVLARFPIDVVLVEMALEREEDFESLPAIGSAAPVICFAADARERMRAVSCDPIACLPLPVGRTALADALDRVRGGRPTVAFTEMDYGCYQLPGEFVL